MATVSPLLNKLIKRNEMIRAEDRRNSPDNSWDYLNELSDSWRQSLGKITSAVSQSFQFLDYCQAYSGEARVLIEGLQTELLTQASKWKTLSSFHEGKRGFGKDAEEHSLILNTALDYIQSHENFMSACSFSAPRLQELVTEQEYKLQQEVKAQEKLQLATPFESLALNTNI